jgi:hypothetical protein
MAKTSKTPKAPKGYDVQRIDAFEGLNTDHPASIAPEELSRADNAMFTLAGRIQPRPGELKRFSSDFDPGAVRGLGGFYKSDGTTRLVMAAGTTLYSDTPHVIFNYQSQVDWTQSGVYDNTTTTSSGIGLPILGTLVNYNTSAWEIGWRFTLNETALTVNQLRIYCVNPPVAAITINLWNATGTKLASVSVTAIANAWVSGSITPVVLSASTSYVISVSWPSGTNSSYSTIVSYAANPLLTIEEGRMGTLGAFPTTIDSADIYGIVDIGYTYYGGIAMVTPPGNAFARLSAAYMQNGTQVTSGTPRYYSCNMLTANQSNIETSLDPGYTPIGTGAVTRDNTYAWEESYSIKVVSQGALYTGVSLRNGSGGSWPVTAGQYYTASFYARGNTGGKQIYIAAFNNDGTEIGNNAPTTLINTGWTRLTYTFQIPTGKTGVYLSAFQNDTNSHTYWVDGIQIENKQYATSWQVGDGMGSAYFGEALQMEEGTTNLLTANRSHPTSGTTGFTAANGATLSIDATETWAGTSSLKVVTTSANNYEGVYVSTNSPNLGEGGTPVTAGNSYAVSFHLYGSGSIGSTLYWYNSSGTQIGAPLYLPGATATSAWQEISGVAIAPATATFAVILVCTEVQAAVTFWVDGIQIENKQYATSWITGSATRAAETLTIPTAGVFAKGNWAVEMVYIPTSNTLGTQVMLCSYEIDSNNYFDIRITSSGYLSGEIKSGGTFYDIVDTVALTVGTPYRISFSGDGTHIRLCKEGSQIGSDLAYVEPVGTLPANMYIGSWAGGTAQCDGLIDDLRTSSRARTLAEHQAYVTNQQPQAWDVDTTYLLSFDGNLNYPATRQSVWQSPVLNAFNASDYSTLEVLWVDNQPSGTTDFCQARTSADGVNWSNWYSQINGGTASAPPEPYSQIRFILQEISNAGSPNVSTATVSYAGNPSAAVIKAGMAPASKYFFGQLQDTMIVFNGADIPVSYDGTNVNVLSAAPRAATCAIYANRTFAACTPGYPARLYYSDPLDMTSWPAINFQDVNPSDGDQIMSLIATSTMFVIIKQHQSYYLAGGTYTGSAVEFNIYTAGSGGTISPWGAIWTPRGFFLLDRDGIWATDFRKSTLLTRKIQNFWNSLNQSLLGNAALFYYKNKLIAAVPSENATYNDTLLVYDMSNPKMMPWSIWRNWTPACFLSFWERGEWKYVYGSSVSGNVFEMEQADNDSGTPITVTVDTAQLPLIGEDWQKRLKYFDVAFGGGATDTTVEVSPIIDGVIQPPVSFTVPAANNLTVKRLYPYPYARTAGLELIWSAVENSGPVFLGYALAFYPRAMRPERVW